MKKLNDNKSNIKPFTVSRWLRYMLIPTVVLLVLTYFVLRGSLYTNSEAVVGYNEIGTIDYKVYLKDNNYYNNKYLGSDMQYIASLIDTINPSFRYEMHSEEKMDYTYKYSIKGDLIITDPNDNNKILYKKSNVFVPEEEKSVKSGGFRIDEKLNINYDEYNNYVNAFKKEYALSVKSRLVITMQVDVVGKSKVLKDDFKKTSNLVMAIPLSEQTINIGIDTSDINNSGVLEKNYLSLIKEPLALILGIIVLILSLCLLYITLYTIITNRSKKDIYKSTIKGIMRDYDRAIVSSSNIDAIDMNKYRIIDVDSFEELLDAHDTTELPILYNEIIPNVKSLFIIISGDILYRYTINRVDLEKVEKERIAKKNEYIQNEFYKFYIFKKKDKKATKKSGNVNKDKK